MSSVITAPTYDPVNTATSLAQKAIADAQSQLTNQSNTAKTTATALLQLGSVISAFQVSLASLASTGKSILAQSATLSDNSVGTASAKAGAADSSYSLFVEALATAGKVSYNNLADGVQPGGTLSVNVGSTRFNVDLSGADTDHNNTLSVREIAAAINRASGNIGLVSAGVVTVGNDTRLVLSSQNTGAANTISLDATDVQDAGLQAALGQVYNNVPDVATPTGTLSVNVGSSRFDVDTAAADADGDGTLTVGELAAAINGAAGNTGLVSASVVTVGGSSRLVLNSKNTSAANAVSLDASQVSDSALQAALQPPAKTPSTSVTLGQDAVVWLGGKTGTKITQASNTFTNIDGVSFTAKRAQDASEKDITLTVANDTGATTANAQAFVDAYNKLKSAIDGMVNAGNSASNQSAGAFANDSGVKALQSQLVALLRPAAGGLSLASYGITAARDGTLQLDSGRLAKQLANNPDGLDQLMGSAAAGNASGLLGKLNTYLNQWSDASAGQIQKRTTANTKLQSDLSKRQDTLNTQYDAAYQRYLKQFTDLQTLQATMNSNVSMFDALFGNDKSS
jgi:flagellar hook-associated protein 2